jgi:putative ABC transport system substrate-binding protein
MRRRDFITLVGCTAVWPLAAYAQQPLPLIGFVHVGSAKALGHLATGFRQGLKETGYIEGQNVALELRWADGQTSRLPEMVADLLRRHVAVLVTGGGEAPVFAAKAATSTIPISGSGRCRC